jgi:ferric-dicitrate binding protein FerR (iron transport regulator)
MSTFKQATAVLVCFMISPLAALCEPQGGPQRAGQIDALIPSATRNAQPTKAKDEIDWNDLLKTAHSGRVRAGLTDGSILSVGSDSELRVVQHDGASQQTSLELNYGKVRNQVTNITKAGGKYELTTPNAVIGVIGTDFLAMYKSGKTTVYCYKGTVKVTPRGKVAQNTGKQSSNDNSVTLQQGQMVVITSTIPAAGFQASDTPPDVAQSGLLATDVPEGNLPAPGNGVNPGHGLRNLLIGGAISTGLAVGLAVGTSSGGCRPTVGVKGNCP